MSAVQVLALPIGGVDPSVLRELSGIYPNFASALKEVVNNSYDAGAHQVAVIFSPNLDVVTVQDDGNGMTPLDLRDNYLRIGGSSHRTEAAALGNRDPIGSKGIGFLAVARYCTAVEIHSYANRTAALTETVPVGWADGVASRQSIAFMQGPLAEMAAWAHVDFVRSREGVIPDTGYRQEGSSLILNEDVWYKVRGTTLDVGYSIDCRGVSIEATIDYDRLFSLEDAASLENLEDFCELHLVDTNGDPPANYTTVALHLREPVSTELRSSQRPGRVRNIASASGIDRFKWFLSRSTPLDYRDTREELSRRGVDFPASAMLPTRFSVVVTDHKGKKSALRRPFVGNVLDGDLGQKVLACEQLFLEKDGLQVEGCLIALSQAIYPAELRGIAIRVRGVDVGKPDYLGLENHLPARYRSYLSQVMGEVVVHRGLNARRELTPGRVGFYHDNEQYLTLRQYLVGDGVVLFGKLGRLLDRVSGLYSLESSVSRIIQDAKRRRAVLIEISQALTELSVSSAYGRKLRRLFNRTDIEANGLSQSPLYEDRLPVRLGEFALEAADLSGRDYEVDNGTRTVRISRSESDWKASVYILGRSFQLSLRSGQPSGPLCEVDFKKDILYLNWAHPVRGKLGDGAFIKSALYWRIAYLAADGNVDSMMNLAHRLLAHSTEES